MTVGAIVIGVVTVTFAIGLTRSLNLVQAGISRTQQVQVEVFGVGGGSMGPGGPVAVGPGGPPVASPGLTEAQLRSTIAAQAGTAQFVGERQQNVTVAGAGEPVPLTAYQGDSSWIGYPIISGRWFHTAGEAVAPSNFFKRTGHHVGDSITATLESGQQVRLTLVGEIFDQQNDNILLRADWGALPGSPVVQGYEIQLKPGTDRRAYAEALQMADPGLAVSVRGGDGIGTALLLIESTLGGLALILTLIAVAGVFNTVVLNTREKARDIAILKAIGMTPRQVVAMVLASVALLGIVGALVGIPAGIALHANILVLMGQIASSTGIPKAFFQVFGIPMLVGLGLAGIAIAMLGAMLPAQWAAHSRVTEVLQAE
jgi:putative ABC transport system permease protein